MYVHAKYMPHACAHVHMSVAWLAGLVHTRPTHRQVCLQKTELWLGVLCHNESGIAWTVHTSSDHSMLVPAI